MKAETAKALHELGNVIAKSQSFEGEIIMTVICRTEEVPDYFYNEETMNEISNYLEQIESEYSRIRGKYSPLSPMDWQLADSWEQKGIPLHVVLTAMSEVFRKFEDSKRGGKINSLSYFTQEVEKSFTYWSANQVGKADETEECEDDFEDYGFEVEPLSDDVRRLVLESFRAYKAKGMNDFIASVQDIYKPEDWTWLMENLEEKNND